MAACFGGRIVTGMIADELTGWSPCFVGWKLMDSRTQAPASSRLASPEDSTSAILTALPCELTATRNFGVPIEMASAG